MQVQRDADEGVGWNGGMDTRETMGLQWTKEDTL